MKTKTFKTVLLLAIAALILGLIIGYPSTAHSGTISKYGIPQESKYDMDFKKYGSQYMTPYEWQWLKAQCFQESKLNPGAVSPVGAQGLCQFMPKTWKDMEKQTGIQDTPFSPRTNIQFASIYMHQMISFWSKRDDVGRPALDKLKLSQASYNAGAGNILKAQRKAGDNKIQPVMDALPQITGPKFSHETQTYVIRIQQWFDHLKR